MIGRVGLQTGQIKAEVARGILDLNRCSFAINYVGIIFKEDVRG